jgi:hypothetical protein
MEIFKREDILHPKMRRIATVALALGIAIGGCAAKKEATADKLSHAPSLEEVIKSPRHIAYDPLPSFAGQETYGPTDWARIHEGLELSRTPVYQDTTLVDVITAVRIDPAKYGFRVFSTYSGKEQLETHSIDNWLQRATGPDGEPIQALFSGVETNQPYGDPAFGIIQDGQKKGTNGREFTLTGLFLAEPKDKSLPLATIINASIDTSIAENYSQGVESLLIIGKGIPTRLTTIRSNHIALGNDADGKIIVAASEGGNFTYSGFAHALTELPLRLENGIYLESGRDVHLALPGTYTLSGAYNTASPKDPTARKGESKLVSSAIGIYER